MQSDMPFPITERYITEWVLPKEPIVSWIRWDKNIEVEKVVLEYDPDAFIMRYLNINGKVFEQDAKSGKVMIPRDYLDVPGFFGFHAVYTVIPESERQLEFVAQFHYDNKIHEERLQTRITRPILECSVEPSDLLISSNESFQNAIKIDLRNNGSVHARSATFMFELHATSDLKVDLRSDSVPDNRRDNIAQETPMNAIHMKGKGKALIRIKLEYFDNLNNKYFSPIVATISLDVRERTNEEITINGLRPSGELPLLLAAQR